MFLRVRLDNFLEMDFLAVRIWTSSSRFKIAKGLKQSADD